MKILFIAAGPIQWGSSRMRCYWVAEQMENADIATFEQWVKLGDYEAIIESYDVFILQKYGHPAIQKEIIKRGKRVYWDVCDPMWWFTPHESREICKHVTGVVTSSEALVDDFLDWMGDVPVTCIPDRLKLSHFPKQRQHQDVTPVRFIWYGVAVNRIALAGAWANLCRLKANGYEIELTVFDDRPDAPLGFGNEVPVYHVRWNMEQENEIIASHDIALLPPYPGPWGQVKSNNKVLTANACGLPVSIGYDYCDLVELVTDYELRLDSGMAGHEITNRHYNVVKSAQAWQRLIDVR